MDPYLEDDLWTPFHADLAHQIQAQLMPRLRPKYVALVEKRYVIGQSGFGIFGLEKERVIYPEVLNPLPEEAPVRTVEIREVDGRRLVTVIEILSPANKHGKGALEYAERRLSILQTQTHLLEFDLLRGGTRIPFIGELPPAPYYVFLSRFTRRPRTEVWTVGLRDRLPAIPVPLLPPDPDVPLDVQAAVKACFDLVGYERLLDYTQLPPPPEMSAEDRDWVRAQIEAVRAEPSP